MRTPPSVAAGDAWMVLEPLEPSSEMVGVEALGRLDRMSVDSFYFAGVRLTTPCHGEHGLGHSCWKCDQRP